MAMNLHKTIFPLIFQQNPDGSIGLLSVRPICLKYISRRHKYKINCVSLLKGKGVAECLP